MELKRFWISIYHLQCSICGQLFWLRTSPYCSKCVSQVRDQFRLSQRLIGRSPHYYLLSWKPGESDLISFFLKALKSHPSPEVYYEAAKIFLRDWKQRQGFHKTILVPIPSQGKNHHAYHLARAMSVLSGYEVWDVLDLGSGQAQKSLGRLERKNRQIGLRKNFTKQSITKGRVILIDDVVTTGETIKAAQKALGSRPISEVWTLAYRERKELSLG